MIRTTVEQRAGVLKALRSPGRALKEKVWTYLVATILDDPTLDQTAYLKLLCGEGVARETPRIEPWFEAQPLSPRLGVPGLDHESNSKIDLAIGAIALRDRSANGIAFDTNCPYKWACFVEAKFFEDSASRTTNDPYRNQLERDIESLLCFQANHKFPERLYFTILTPRKLREKPRSRLYGYRVREYRADKSTIVRDIEDFALGPRMNIGQLYPPIREQVEKLEINWVTYEEVFELAFGLPRIDLLDRSGVRTLEEKLDAVADELEIQLRAAVARDGPEYP